MGKKVLVAGSVYTMKNYFNEEFAELPAQIKDELIEIVTVYSARIHGELIIGFYEDDGVVYLEPQGQSLDCLYDDIGAGMEIIALEKEKAELFNQLQKWYMVFKNENR
ncbi:MAG: DUF6145 family protein [Lachnospirales bacterium]